MKYQPVYLIFLLTILSCKKDKEDKLIITDEKHKTQLNSEHKTKSYEVKNIGDTLDVFNDVYVIYNKNISNTSGRHLTKDGYNLGLKWQCVEFVKRYYYEHLNHKMPNSYGHAKDFYNPEIVDGEINYDRNLIQFTNGSITKPTKNDLLVFDGNVFNPYGHVAIISKVEDDFIEIVQQNVGKNSRAKIDLSIKNGQWFLDDSEILGWLRK